MIKQAQAELNIDLARSFFIGDSAIDILCGNSAGLVTVGVATGNGCKDARTEPDYFFENLYEAADFIINHDYDNYANTIVFGT